MATANTRAFITWMRDSFAIPKLTEIGHLSFYASMPKVNLNNDQRVLDLINWLLGREQTLIGEFTDAYEPYWAPAQDEVWAEFGAKWAIVTDTATIAGYNAILDDLPQVFRLFMRVLSREVQEFKAQQAGV